MAYKILSRDEHYKRKGPKRILALDGGGLRGILTLSMLAQIEAMLRKRHGNSKEFRLCHYFDLIAGTSTGAIIAAALCRGMTVAEIIRHYNDIGKTVFQKSIWRKGFIRALYGRGKLVKALKEIYEKETTMGSDSLKTGLLIVSKRLDTSSPWPISNNPDSRYYHARPGSDTIANADYPLWQVVRASTAAPRYFTGESINIIKRKGKKPVAGIFVDGGVSPFNNPSLQAFMFATLAGYKVEWPTGANKLLLVSLGTGSRDPQVSPMVIEAGNALKSLVSLMDDCAALVETMLQWMSTSPTARTIDRELGDLQDDLIAKKEQFTYLRYNVDLSDEYLRDELGLSLPAKKVESLTEMDTPENMPILQEIGEVAGKKLIRPTHFPSSFNLS